MGGVMMLTLVLAVLTGLLDSLVALIQNFLTNVIALVNAVIA
ncbi:hypothetical protein ACH0R4_RS13250 [Bacillus cytotoxicus]|nr:hypothetical protein [Bacillus cereus group sp. BfR-BA-01492]